MLFGQTTRLVSFLPSAPEAMPAGSSVQPNHADLEKFIREHHAFVWRCARRLGVPLADVDDAVQEIFIGIAARREPITHARAFLFRACTFAAAHARRKSSQRHEVSDELQLERAVDTGESPERSVEHERERQELQSIIDAMPDELRAVFVLFELERLTMAEIAEIAELPRGTVASRLRRARELFERRATLHGKAST